MLGTSLAIGFMKTVACVYDVLTFPFQVIVQKPWQKWKTTIAWAKREDDNPYSPYTSTDSTVPAVPNDIQTLDQLFHHLVCNRRGKTTFGTREVLKQEEEIQENGKVFKKAVLGKYKWTTIDSANEKIWRYSRSLLSLGLKSQDKIALFAETRLEWMLMVQACFRINILVITVYPNLGDEGLVHAINEADASFIVTSESLLKKVKKIAYELKTITHVIYMEGSEIPDLVGFPTTINLISFSQLECLVSDLDPEKPYDRPTPDDLAVLMYTSGSTGAPKGVMLTHKNIVYAIKGLCCVVTDYLPPNSEEVYIAYLPLAHIMELASELVMIAFGFKIGYSSPLTLSDSSTGLAKGCRGDAVILQPTILFGVPVWKCCVRQLRRKHTIGQVLAVCEYLAYRIRKTHKFDFCVGRTFLQEIVENRLFPAEKLMLDRIRKSITEVIQSKGEFSKSFFKFALSYKDFWYRKGFETPILNRIVFRKIRNLFGGRVKIVFSASAPLNPDTQDFIRTCLGVTVVQGYGMTETSAAATAMRCKDPSTGTVGPPLLTTKIRLVDWDEGNYYVTDEPNPRGEIVVGGDSVSSGYYMNESLTKESFREEDGIRWFYSGDIGEILPNGNLKIIDRKKDLVKLQHGEYVSLGKVESELKTFSLIDNICVFGNSFQNYIVALVVPSESHLRNLAKEMQKEELTFLQLCQDEEVTATVTRLVITYGKECHLIKAEIPQKLTLCSDEWVPDTGLVTPSFKLRRKAIEQYYQNILEAMYEIHTSNV